MVDRKSVAVFAAGQQGIEEIYKDVAYETGKILAEEGFTLVSGGGYGLMEASCKGSKDANGYVIGVGLQKLEEKNAYIDRYYERVGIHSRQSTLITLADAFIALPGGMGTLYEIAEIMELKKLGEEESEPVIVINSYGFYDGLKMQLEKMRENEYVLNAFSNYVVFVENPREAISIIKSFYANPASKV
jgi:uncharacterized protein (TIGR00730 family)